MPRLSSLSALLLTACVLMPESGLADNSLSPSIVPPTAPKSEFLDDPSMGKDPFFPKSSRRKFVPKVQDDQPPDPTVPEFIVLKGFSVFQGRKLAIINNYTVGEGEEFVLRANGQVLKVQCVEIKDKGVVVSVGGATKEIPLPRTLQ